MSSRMLFETLAGVGKTENLDKSILEHGFDEHRFMDKAGRMGLSISRKGMQVVFTQFKSIFTFSLCFFDHFRKHSDLCSEVLMGLGTLISSIGTTFSHRTLEFPIFL